MCRVLLFSLGVVMMVGLSSASPSCVHRAISCCNTNLGQKLKDERLMECFKGPPNPHSCEVDICVGQKMGYATADGTFIKEVFLKNLDEMFPNGTEYNELVKKNCVDGDISVYGEKDFCDLKKIQICSFIQYVKVCDDWKDEDRCKGAEEAAAECIKDYN